MNDNKYILATGEAAESRLSLLNRIFGPPTKELLTRIGIAAGWHVADIGCGSGQTAVWMATQVGAGGSVSAVDGSADQLDLAKRNAIAAGVKNVSFHQADAYSTGLPRDSFDMVYSRFLMCHLTNPAKALKEMRELLKKGGVLVCEDYEQDSVMTDPPTRAYARLCEISRELDAKRGLDSNIGLKLHRLFRGAGFQSPEISLRQTVFLRGEEKRLWELTLREAAPAILGEGIATADELESLCSEMGDIARDETVLVVLARVSQVWAMKSISSWQ